jgi:diaminopimelate epimerase
MILYNADGGEAEMCGNGVRCLATYLVNLEDKWTQCPFEYNIWTKAGRIVAKVCAWIASPTEHYPNLCNAYSVRHRSLEMALCV